MSKVRVAIDFRVDDPRQGVGTAVLALAHGLSKLVQQGHEQEYLFLVYEHTVEWLRPHVSGPCSVVVVDAPAAGGWKSLKTKLRRVPFLRRLWLRLHSQGALVPHSDGFLESLGCDVVHFPSQIAYTTGVPSIYQPWDLQHCHYPEFFTEDELRLRNARYPAFCRAATFVCVQTEWGKQDLVEHYGIDPDKVTVIRWGTAFEAYSAPSETEIERVRGELSLPPEFFLYPAITWPHKNHELIVRALAELKATGRRVDVVCTGATTPYRHHLDVLANRLGVADRIHYLGFVTSEQIQALYKLATAMIFPSKFEGLGLPVLEAFRVGLPVLCSTATVLPEVAGEAALFFDPNAPDQLIARMEQLSTSPELRASLAARGREVLTRYSADDAALEFAALYKATAQEGSVHA